MTATHFVIGTYDAPSPPVACGRPLRRRAATTREPALVDCKRCRAWFQTRQQPATGDLVARWVDPGRRGRMGETTVGDDGIAYAAISWPNGSVDLIDVRAIRIISRSGDKQ